MSGSTIDLLRDPAEELTKALAGVATYVSDIRPIQRKVALDLLAGVVKRTPVDEGVARGGWQLSIGDHAPAPRDGVTPDKEGAVTVTAGLRAVADLPQFSCIWLSNDVPYIIILDQGGFVPPSPGPSSDPRKDRFGRVLVQDGYSMQAPQGMVDITLAEIVEALR